VPCRFWPVRTYEWGTVQALATPHSDLPLLKRLLFEAGASELKAATEARYYAARESALAAGCATQMYSNQCSAKVHQNFASFRGHHRYCPRPNACAASGVQN